KTFDGQFDLIEKRRRDSLIRHFPPRRTVRTARDARASAARKLRHRALHHRQSAALLCARRLGAPGTVAPVFERVGRRLDEKSADEKLRPADGQETGVSWEQHSTL